MKFSDARGRQVVSTSTAQTVAKVAEFVVDPATHSVVAIELRKSDHGDVLRYSDITGFGDDAVTVAGIERLGLGAEEVADLLGKDHHLVGKRVLSDAGDELGQVADIEFDPETGVLTDLVLKSGTVAGPRLIGVGSYAVVVEAESDQR